jgi:hypothetical protein
MQQPQNPNESRSRFFPFEKAPAQGATQQKATPPPPVTPTKLQVIIKTVVGESHEMEVSSLSKEKLLEALQLAIERELGVPTFRQRLLADGGRASLRTAAQLNRTQWSLPPGTKLTIQLVTKRDFFPQCSQHRDYEGKILCVPCGKVLCHKCLFSHINGAQDSPNHALADLEDGGQFGSAMKAILERADSRLQEVLRKAQENVRSSEKEWLQRFDCFQKQRLAHSKAALSWSDAALAKLRRSNLRTTLDMAVWVLRARQSGDFSESPQRERRNDPWLLGNGTPNQRDAQAKRHELCLNAPTNASVFQPCSVHPTQRETVLCVQCNKMMCLKCFAQHGNRVQGHQCADMEEPPQFIEVVQPYFESIVAELEKNDALLQRQENRQSQDLSRSFTDLWSAWASFILALKRLFEAEVSVCARELATTPLELLQWLQTGSFYSTLTSAEGRAPETTPTRPQIREDRHPFSKFFDSS